MVSLVWSFLALSWKDQTLKISCPDKILVASELRPLKSLGLVWKFQILEAKLKTNGVIISFRGGSRSFPSKSDVVLLIDFKYKGQWAYGVSVNRTQNLEGLGKIHPGYVVISDSGYERRARTLGTLSRFSSTFESGWIVLSCPNAHVEVKNVSVWVGHLSSKSRQYCFISEASDTLSSKGLPHILAARNP